MALVGSGVPGGEFGDIVVSRAVFGGNGTQAAFAFIYAGAKGAALLLLRHGEWRGFV